MLKASLRTIFNRFTMALRTSIKWYKLLVNVTLRMVATVDYWFKWAHFIFTLRYMYLLIIWWHRCLILMLTAEWIFFLSIIIYIILLIHSTTRLRWSSFIITCIWIKWTVLVFLSFFIHNYFFESNCNVFLYFFNNNLLILENVKIINYFLIWPNI